MSTEGTQIEASAAPPKVEPNPEMQYVSYPMGMQNLGQGAGVDVLLGVALPGSQAEQEAVAQAQMHAIMQQQLMQGVDPSQMGPPMIVQVPMQGIDPAQAIVLQGMGPDGTVVPVDPNGVNGVGAQSAPPNRFKPSAKQRADMEQAVRAGGYKRKCKELEEYARHEGLPYKAVLSWFDRNKSRLMQLDAQPTTQLIPCGQPGPDGALVADPGGIVVPITHTTQRFKPTPEQIIGVAQP